MPLLNEASLDRYRNLRKGGTGADDLLEEAMEKSASAAVDERFDVFLSHASKDRDNGFLAPLLWRLQNASLSVYVDAVVDRDMDRSKSTATTAKRIRNRMRHSKVLLYATSPRAVVSGWMKWELGLADGMNKRIAVVPVLPGSTVEDTFETQAFIGLYPCVVEADDDATTPITRLFIPPPLMVQTVHGEIPIATWVHPTPRLVIRSGALGKALRG